MKREELRAALNAHAPSDPREVEALSRIQRFLAAPADPFARTNPEGHVTGSAIVVRPDGSEFLLVYHRKLSRWLQPGGHTEVTDASIFATALREAREETGITGFDAPFFPAVLDVDVHAIPAHGKDAAHSHLDIRYLLTSSEASHAENAEDPARPMRWVSMSEALSMGVDLSLARALEKARALLARSLDPVAEEP